MMATISHAPGLASLCLASQGDPRARRVARHIDWLTLLASLEADPADAANPFLVDAALRRRLEPLPVRGTLKLLEAMLGRGGVLGGLVEHQYGAPSRLDPLQRVLVDQLRGEIDALEADHGELLATPLRLQAAQRIEAAVAQLIDGLDPRADMARLTGEPCPVQLRIHPCRWLPPPQRGRHGVHIRLGTQSTAWLMFGYPLHVDPRSFGIDRQFLCNGTWHYTITAYLDRVWPGLHGALLDRAELAEAFGPPGEAAEAAAAWPMMVRKHLQVALRYHLSVSHGMPRRYFQLLSGAKGLPLFDWFVDWLEPRVGPGLTELLSTLPAALCRAAARGELVPASATPAVINLSLVSSPRDSIVLVFPDRWSTTNITRAAARWDALAPRVMRYAQWSATNTDEGNGRVIAFGSPSDNPVVADVLARGRPRLPVVPHDAVLVALDAEPGLGHWRMAVTSLTVTPMVTLTLELAVRLTCSFAVVEGTQVRQADGITAGHERPQPSPRPTPPHA